MSYIGNELRVEERTEDDAVTGLKMFDIDKLGRLVGAYQSNYVYRPGENVATCYKKHPDNRAADFECGTCGFHANARESSYQDKIVGLVKGYGQTVIADDGFRSEKMKIVALAPCKIQFPHALNSVFGFVLGVAIAIANLFCAMYLGVTVSPLFLNLFFLVPVGIFIIAISESDNDHFLDMKRLKQLYPDVNFYSSKVSIFARQHWVEDDLSPETCPDFWDREV